MKRPFRRLRQAEHAVSLSELLVYRCDGSVFSLLLSEDQMKSILADSCSFNFSFWLWFVLQFEPVLLTLADWAFGDRCCFLISEMPAEQRALPLATETVRFREAFRIFVAFDTKEHVCTAMELSHCAAQITLECNETQGVLWTSKLIFDAELA